MTRQKKSLIESARMGDIDGIKAALAAGANIHADDDALYWAACHGHVEVVRLLLAAGANVHVHDDGALRWAADQGRTNVVRVLLAARANIHADDDAALRWAAKNSHTDVVRVLLAAGASPSIALKNTPEDDRGDVTTTLDACATVLSQEQRTELLDLSRPGELVRLRAIVASSEKRCGLRR